MSRNKIGDELTVQQKGQEDRLQQQRVVSAGVAVGVLLQEPFLLGWPGWGEGFLQVTLERNF